MFNQSEFTSGEHKNKRPAYTPSYSSLISWEGLYMARSKSGLLGLQSDLMDHFTL